MFEIILETIMNFHYYTIPNYEPNAYTQFLLGNTQDYIAIVFAVLSIVSIGAYMVKSHKVYLYTAYASLITARFSLQYFVVDEAYVNFSHPYNLWHNGIFSFSPTEKIGGTVEILYFLLLTPFAYNHISLYMGSMILTAVFITIIVVYAYKIILHYTDKQYEKILGICLFVVIYLLFSPLLLSVHKYIAGFMVHSDTSILARIVIVGRMVLAGINAMTIFNYGFGTAMSTMLFVGFIYNVLHNRSATKIGVFGFLFAFARPENMLWAGCVLFAKMCHNRQIPLKQSMIVLSGTISFFLVYYLYFGVVIPNPIALKMGIGGDIVSKLQNIWVYVHQNIVVLMSVLIVLIVNSYKKGIFFVMLSLSTFVLSVAIISNQLVYEVSKLRYVSNFMIVLYMGIAIFISDICSPYVYKKRHFVNVFVCIIILLLLLQSGHFAYRTMYKQKNLDFFSRHIMGNIIPKNMSLMSNQVSAMFYMRDNYNIYEIWGYTNPDIVYAQCKMRADNGYIYKHHPSIIPTYTPDVVYMGNFNKVEMHAQDAIYKGRSFLHLGKDTPNVKALKDSYKLFLLEISKQNYQSVMLMIWVKNTKVEKLGSYFKQFGGLHKVYPLPQDYFDKVFTSQLLEC